MYKLISLHKGAEPEGFRDHFLNKHQPLVAKMPGIVRMNHAFDVKNGQGEDAYFCVTEVYFDSFEDMMKAAKSPEGERAAEEARSYDRGETQVIHFAVPDE